MTFGSDPDGPQHHGTSSAQQYTGRSTAAVTDCDDQAEAESPTPIAPFPERLNQANTPVPAHAF